MDVLSNAARNVRVRRDGVGSFTKGNRYTVTTVRTTVLAADMPRSWHGDTATMPYQSTLDKIADRAISAGYTKRNKPCPGCGMLRSTANKCECNS